MDIKVRTENDISIVQVTGKLDALTATRYEQALNQLMAAGALRLIVDFQDLSYISSAGLRALLNTIKPLMARGGRLIFTNLQPAVYEVFAMTNLLSIFMVRDDLATALAELA